MENSINPGVILSARYRIIRELGHGGFGRTYLAEDINRFNEACVLKEFAPQLQGSSALQKAEELFQREAGVLYKLQHPQIPRFREMFRVEKNNKGLLFLVQDYVDGQNYRSLLISRQTQGLKFSEQEVTLLMTQILPVLEYIHSIGVIHRDISPDNLMLRSSDLLPVLIDFGGVKEVAATVNSQLLETPSEAATVPISTRLGKVGYAPEEQMHRGIVAPHSDLYALAATVLVLLTGREPQQLINPQTLDWEWSHIITLSPKLTKIIQQMLAKQPGDRFQWVREVIQALNQTQIPPPDYSVTQQPASTEATVAVAPPANVNSSSNINSSSNTSTPIEQPSPSAKKTGLNILSKISILLLLLFGAGGIGWVAGNVWINQIANQPNPPTPSPPDEPELEPPPPSKFSPEELKRKQDLRHRRLDLGISYNFYTKLIDQEFGNQYPSQKGKTLSDEPEDAEWRQRWDKIAAEMLEKLSFLSREARKGMGGYNQAQRDLWKKQANQLHISSRALYDIADAEFFYRFPKQKNQQFINQPIGQIWNAIVVDKLKALQSKINYERIVFPSGAITTNFSGNLPPGGGKAYIADLGKDQIMEVKLKVNQEALFSVYTPSGKSKILEDSKVYEWSGILPEKGYYEFVIVSTAKASLNYKLTLTVENPLVETPSPETPSSEITPSETPSPETPSLEITPSETPEESPSSIQDQPAETP